MVKIIKGDITTLTVNAIVNAANEMMLGGGGVDGAIHDAAGEARITPGFKLPAKFVIHTVGPVYRDGQHGEPEKLAACYRNALALAAENGCKSIAFPCISTGVYGYPIEAAAKIAVGEVREFFSPAESAEVAEWEDACPHAPQSGRARTPAAPSMEVIFCCFSERDKRVYDSLLFQRERER